MMTKQKMIELPKTCVSYNTVIAIVERCGKTKASIKELITFTGKSESYVKEAVTAAELLGMLEKSNDNSYVLTKDCKSDITPNFSFKKNGIDVFRKWLQKWEPFMVFVNYLTTENKPINAARKLCSFYKFNRNEEYVEKLLTTWGRSVKIIDKNDKVTINSSDVINKEFCDSKTGTLVDDASARLFLISNLTEDVFKLLKHDEIEELAQSIIKYHNDPRASIECAGRAFEDVIRRITVEKGISAKKLNGITELINALYSSYDSSGTSISHIHYKQHDIGIAIGTIRNMAGHGKEAKTLERWTLSPIGAFSFILTVISTIRSIYIYLNKKDLVY